MAKYSPPEGYTLDESSGMYFSSALGTDPTTGAPARCMTWFNADTGEYTQQSYPLAPPPIAPQQAQMYPQMSIAQKQKSGKVAAIIAAVVVLLFGGAVGGHFVGLYTLPFLPADNGDYANSYATADTMHPPEEQPPRGVTVPETEAAPPGPGAAETPTDDFYYWYSAREGGIVLDGYYGSGPIVHIPARIDGQAVTVIGFSLFEDMDFITEIHIPDGVTTIWNHAFARTGITSIVIPASVQEIGFGAFSWAQSLTAIYFEGDIPDIGGAAFVATHPDLVIFHRPGAQGLDQWSIEGIPTATW